MNEKASILKEINKKHRKILEGLLKLPENRECADCKARSKDQSTILYQSRPVYGMPFILVLEKGPVAVPVQLLHQVSYEVHDGQV
ncbi:hypothetical protein COCNU_scaffold047331G000010 [Cocos nucifera]|nr:hypothetical protein [Cocos nucifera]